MFRLRPFPGVFRLDLFQEPHADSVFKSLESNIDFKTHLLEDDLHREMTTGLGELRLEKPPLRIPWDVLRGSGYLVYNWLYVDICRFITLGFGDI